MPPPRKLLFPYCYSVYRQEFFGRHRDWLAAHDLELVLADDDIGPKDLPIFAEAIIMPNFEQDLAQTVDVLDRYVQERGADGILAHSEASLLASAIIAERYDFPTITTTAALACTNKYVTRQLLARANVPIPRFALVDSAAGVRRFAAENGGYPLMIKATVSVMARNVIKVAAESEVEAAVARVRHGIQTSPDVRRCVSFARLASLDMGCDPTRQFLVEEYVEGEPVETDGLVRGESILTFGVTDQVLTPPPHIYMDGYLFPSDRPAADVAHVLHVSDSALRAIELGNAAFAIEMRYDGKQAKLIEINGRLGEEDVMGEMVFAALGIYPMLELIKIAARIVPGSEPPGSKRCAIAFLNYLQDGTVRRTPEPAELERLRSHGARVVVQAPVGSHMHAPPHHEVFPHLAYVACTDTQSSWSAYRRARAVADQLRFEFD